MNHLRELGPDDAGAVSEILGISYERAREWPIKGLREGAPITPEGIGISPACNDMTDLTTQVAHSLGIAASREFHVAEDTLLVHYLTSFGASERPLSDYDAILCTTWGQSDHRTFERRPFAYFGTRADIISLIGLARYHDYYGITSVRERQITHTPFHASQPLGRHRWAHTTPEAIQLCNYPMGEVGSRRHYAFGWRL